MIERQDGDWTVFHHRLTEEAWSEIESDRGIICLELRDGTDIADPGDRTVGHLRGLHRDPPHGAKGAAVVDRPVVADIREVLLRGYRDAIVLHPILSRASLLVHSLLGCRTREKERKGMNA